MFKEFNNTITPYPSDKTLVDLFEEQVIKTPENIALRWGNYTMTYSELNIQSNLVADYLLTKKKCTKRKQYWNSRNKKFFCNDWHVRYFKKWMRLCAHRS